MKLFSERQFRVHLHPPATFADPKNWLSLAELAGELGKPTLLGYLSEREAHEQLERAMFDKMQTPELIHRGPLHLLKRPEEDGPEKILLVTLRDDRFKYLDTRSENQVIADEVERKLLGIKQPWKLANSWDKEWAKEWNKQSSWFIDGALTGVDYSAEVVETTSFDTFAVAPGSAPSQPLKSWKEFRDKTAAEEIASSAQGESHEKPGAAVAHPVGKDRW